MIIINKDAEEMTAKIDGVVITQPIKWFLQLRRELVKIKVKEMEKENKKSYTGKTLSEKQHQIVVLSISGLSQTEIGRRLGISRQAIANQVKLIKNKGYDLKTGEKNI